MATLPRTVNTSPSNLPTETKTSSPHTVKPSVFLFAVAGGKLESLFQNVQDSNGFVRFISIVKLYIQTYGP
jgi:hypothetical protein